MRSAANQRLPLGALLALALAGFITILTEALPAGLLPQISAGLGISQALAGQLVTLYAVGSLLAAIPLTALTQALPRRRLLLAAIAGFVLANTLTTFSHSYALTLCARFVAGAAAGLLWSLLAGCAARMVPEAQTGRAIAVAMVGTPLALSVGVPLGTLIGHLLGWRLCFGLMSVLALLSMLWVRMTLPDFAGQVAGRRLALVDVFGIAGVRAVLFAVLGFVLAHNILYTYIAVLLDHLQMAARTDAVLLVFGICAVLGIWIIGIFIDRHLRALSLASTLLFALAALALALAGPASLQVYLAVAVWGLAFGGAATLFQTAIVNTAGKAADVAQSMLVTAWNTGIAAGGSVGGLLLQQLGVVAFTPVVLALLAAVLVVIAGSRRHGFAAHGEHRADCPSLPK